MQRMELKEIIKKVYEYAKNLLKENGYELSFTNVLTVLYGTVDEARHEFRGV